MPTSRVRVVLTCAAMCLLAVSRASAQSGPPSADNAVQEGVLPDAAFEAGFRKYTPPPDIFSPFYSWDAHMRLNLTVLRRGPSAVIWEAIFQTVGTENLGSKISVGGTGYLLRLGYVRTYSERLTMTAGISHLSTHLTRDLDDKLDKERSHGRTIPIVEDESEYNVVYLKANLTLTSWPFTPELEAVVQPINFQFNGSRAGYVRPVYLRSRTTLWRRDQKAVVAETEHEIGKNAFNRFVAAFEFTSAMDGRRRVEMFVSASPGHNLHVSPMIGGLRDGIAFGLRMHFRAS